MTLALYGKTRRRQVWLLALALFAVLGATLFAVGQREETDASHGAAFVPPSTFEVDGNTVVDDAGTIDWATPPPNYTVANEVCDNSSESQHDDNDTINDPPGPEGSTTSSLEIGPVQDKNDFCQAQYAFEFIGQDIFLYLSWTRISDNGTGVIYFELNQSNAVAAGSGGLIERTTGDVLIVYDYQGGGTPVLGYRTWGGSSWGGVTTLPNAVAANADTNLFGEAAIKLDDIFRPGGGEECGGFANVTLHSTTGNADTSTLQDILGPTPLVVNNCPNIRIDKTNDQPNPVPTGTVVTYTLAITVVNGPLDNVDVVDDLPVGVGAPVTNISNGGVYSGGDGGTITWTDLDLPNGVTNLTYKATVQANATAGAKVNTATVAPEDPEVCRDPASDCSDTSAVTVNLPSLSVLKTADPAGPVSAGDEIGFRVTVSNAAGSGTATNVVVHDPLPDAGDLDWNIDTQTGAACSITGEPGGDTLSCTIPTLAGGASYTVRVEAQTGIASCGEHTNTATIHLGSSTAPSIGSSIARVTVLCGDATPVKTGNGPIQVGANAVYTILVNVSGDAGAVVKNVVLTDTVPSNVAGNWAVTGCGATTSVAPGGLLICNLGNVTVEGDGTTTLTVTLTAPTSEAAGSCDDMSNTAVVSADNDRDNEDDSSTDRIVVLCPDPSITKVRTGGAPENVIVGQPVSYTVTVNNTGDGNATGVVVTDFLPDGMNWTVTPSQGSCLPANPVAGTTDVVCNLGTIPAAGSATITVVGTTNASVCGRLENRASITAAPNDTNTGNNGPVAAFYTVLCPDVEITKIVTPGTAPTVNAGDPVSYTITVGTDEPTSTGNATNVHVIETLPTLGGANVTWTVAPSQGSCTPDSDGGTPDAQAIGGTVMDCNLGTIADGGTATIVVTATTNKFTCGQLRNTASVTAAVDVDPSDNGPVTADIQVLCPDVTVVKSAVNTPINAGESAVFDIVVTNGGAGAATNVSVDDTLSSLGGITWTLTSISNDTGVTCVGIVLPAPDAIPGNVLDCNIASLAAGASVTFRVTSSAVPNSEATCQGIPNSVLVDAENEPEDAPLPNRSSAEVEVNCGDVNVSKTTDTPSVSAGDDIRFTIVTNITGTGSVTNITLTDLLPGNAGLDWEVVGDTWPGDCAITGALGNETLHCGPTTQDAPTSFSVTVQSATTSASCGLVQNRRNLPGTEGSALQGAVVTTGNAGGDSAQADLTVNCPDVFVIKTGSTESPGTIDSGSALTYTIVWGNLGPGVAKGATLMDVFPIGFVANPALSTLPAGCVFLPLNVGVACGPMDLQPGAANDLTIIIVGQVTADVCGPLRNEATVRATNEPENVLGNNTDDTTVGVNCPDVMVTKTGNGPINAGADAVFTITITNLGAGTANNVSLVDNLPSGIVWAVTTQPAGGLCLIDQTLNLLTCNIASIGPNGGFVTIVLTGATDPADCGVLENTVIIDAANEPENQSENNTATGTITVLCPDLGILKVALTPIVTQGDLVEFNVTVTNNGTLPYIGVLFTDTLPGNFDFITVNATSGGCNYNNATRVLTCETNGLAPGASETALIRGTAAACTDIVNTAVVPGDVVDIDPTNDSSTATVDVQCPDITVLKTGTGLINPGDPVSYSITVTNMGPGVAKTVTLSDTLPTGAPSWTVGGPNAAQCNGPVLAGGALLTCNFGDLAENATATITLSGTTPDNGVCGPLQNTVTVAALNEIENDVLPNESTYTIPCVLATGNLVIRKYIDFDGGRDADPGEPLASGWAMHVVCTGNSSLDQTINTGRDGVGTILILGLNEGTTCTVTETTQAGYTARGFDSLDAGGPDTGAGLTASVTIDAEVVATVDFFNQPFGSIVVNKETRRNGFNEPSQNGGWEITVSGCGINQTKNTAQGNPVGTVSFTDLPACPGGYDVSENPNSKPGANPPFSPSGPTSFDVDLEAGETATVTFINVRSDPPPPSTPTPTPTNTPTPTPTNTPTPTPTPTNTPTATPTPIETVAGVITPAPPSTGSGFTSPLGGGSVNMLLLVAGLVAMSGGFFVLAAYRRRIEDE